MVLASRPCVLPSQEKHSPSRLPRGTRGTFFGDRKRLSLETVLEGLFLEKLSLGGHGSLGSSSGSRLVFLSLEGIF